MTGLLSDELIIMATLGCSAEQAHAEYGRIEQILINLGAPRTALTGIVQGDVVNVRQKPSTSAKILAQVRLGEELRVVGRTPAGDWLCVDLELPGWVSAEFVRL
jgi:uncharacterized protein YgiM (DUF1202 family)